jgi:hypothetical protein
VIDVLWQFISICGSSAGKNYSRKLGMLVRFKNGTQGHFTIAPAWTRKIQKTGNARAIERNEKQRRSRKLESNPGKSTTHKIQNS